MFDIYFYAVLSKTPDIVYTMHYGHRFVYTPLKYFVNLSINWPINTLLKENLAFDKYEVPFL